MIFEERECSECGITYSCPDYSEVTLCLPCNRAKRKWYWWFPT